jgi:hypothetical protein
LAKQAFQEKKQTMFVGWAYKGATPSLIGYFIVSYDSPRAQNKGLFLLCAHMKVRSCQ